MTNSAVAQASALRRTRRARSKCCSFGPSARTPRPIQTGAMNGRTKFIAGRASVQMLPFRNAPVYRDISGLGARIGIYRPGCNDLARSPSLSKQEVIGTMSDIVGNERLASRHRSPAVIPEILPAGQGMSPGLFFAIQLPRAAIDQTFSYASASSDPAPFITSGIVPAEFAPNHSDESARARALGMFRSQPIVH